jgi:ACS family hexuronate transporter-like MFS transporter
MNDKKIGNYRWVIATLLLFATTINYADRQVISYLKIYLCSPVSEGGFGWTNSDYGTVTGFFTLFYAGTTILAGYIIDKIGTKLGLAFSLIAWSVFGMANAFAGTSVAINAVLRSFFGFGQAGNFPASVKTVAEWFPKKERALAQGFFNSGTSIGTMVAALFVPWCLMYFGNASGYKMAYLITGALGFIWLFFWFSIYNKPTKTTKLSKEEFDYIHSDEEVVVAHAAPTDDVVIEVQPKVSWFKLLTFPQTWAFFMGKFLTDGVWYFLIFWLPDYLHKQFGMSTEELKWPTFIIYGISIFGNFFGGSLPLYFINKGKMNFYHARMRAMLIIALIPVSLLSIQYFSSHRDLFGEYATTLVIAVLCIGAATHQAWSSNLFTTVSDFFPKRAIGSVIGIGSLGGGIGGFTVQKIVGRLTDHYAATPQMAYTIVFAFCAFIYIIAWSTIRYLTRKQEVIVL